MSTRRWSPAAGAEAMRPPELRPHADRSGPLPRKHISGGFAVTARTERSKTKNMRLEPSAIQRRLWTVSEELTGVTFPGALRPENEPYANRTVGEQRDPKQSTREEDSHDPGNNDRRERRPIPGGVRHEGRRQAGPVRFQGLDGVPRSHRGEPRLGAVRH